MFSGESLLFAGTARRHAMLMCGDAARGDDIVNDMIETVAGPLVRADVLHALYANLPQEARDTLGEIRLAYPVPFLCRAAFVLHEVEGFSLEETGRIILLPEQAIPSFVAVARAALPDDIRHDPGMIVRTDRTDRRT